MTRHIDIQHDWSNIELKAQNNKQSITIRVDHAVLEHFKKTGKGYQTLMNRVLKSYVDSQKSK